MPRELHTIEDVRNYWNTYINDAEVIDEPLGSPEFFDALERYRYDKIDYLKDYVDFGRYAGKSVLEVGCGPGVDLLQFARAGARVTARDLTENAVTLARANLAREGTRATSRRGTRRRSTSTTIRSTSTTRTACCTTRWTPRRPSPRPIVS
jgi:2-polyprenyl-3-methyl-5-hydroxy-6-metoxy-1,4-benzoquinol methylase